MLDKHMLLEDWYMGVNDPYQAPECYPRYIKGKVYGHSDHEDGTRIVTSAIRKVGGDTVTTESGSEYRLGSPSRDYVIWCVNNNCHVPTKEEPIKEI